MKRLPAADAQHAGLQAVLAGDSRTLSAPMKTMTRRTTFALDRVTANRLRRLASLWQVSQAEVVRRTIAQAESVVARAKPDPIAMLHELHAAGQGLDARAAKDYLANVREDRGHRNACRRPTGHQ